jgi:hypothetical protein
VEVTLPGLLLAGEGGGGTAAAHGSDKHNALDVVQFDTSSPTIGAQALGKLRCAKELVIIPGATHLFEEPGKLEKVAEHAATWFADHFTHPGPASSPAGLHASLGEKGVRP